jgi:hypothetical protein
LNPLAAPPHMRPENLAECPSPSSLVRMPEGAVLRAITPGLSNRETRAIR